MISCDKMKSLMVPFLEDELSSTESELVLEHLDSCQSCSELASMLSSFEINLPESYSVSLSQARKDRLDEELLLQLEANQHVEQIADVEEFQEGHVLNFPEKTKPTVNKAIKTRAEQQLVSKEKVLAAALLISFIWGGYQSYQVEKLHSVIQDQQQSLQLQQQSIERMESVIQVRPSSPEPYIMTVSHVPRRMDL